MFQAPSSSNDPPTITQQQQAPLQRRYRILSHPITIDSSHYPRNAYTFNFGLVLDEVTDFHAFIPIVRKLASLFRGLEESRGILSKDTAPRSLKWEDGNQDGGEEDSEDERDEAVEEAEEQNKSDPKGNAKEGTESRIYAVIETLREDLNLYSECMIPISSAPSSPPLNPSSSTDNSASSATTLNLKLFPPHPTPPKPSAWHVPILLIKLSSIIDESWDLTLLRILPFINGVNSVKRIAWLADADFKLVRKAVRELIFYGCVDLMDVFSFGAIYAPTAEISTFVEDSQMQEECGKYVSLPTLATGTRRPSSPPQSRHQNQSRSQKQKDTGKELYDTPQSMGITPTQLTILYLSLRQGQSVKSWAIDHIDLVKHVDIRRFITFGVIKGLLYRVHRYAIATSFSKRASGLSKYPLRRKHSGNGNGKGGKIRVKSKDNNNDDVVREEEGVEKRLAGYLDGTHCFDEICTELEISEKELMGLLKSWRGGDVQILCR